MRIETFDKDVGFRQLSADMALKGKLKKGQISICSVLCLVERGGINGFLDSFSHLGAFGCQLYG